VRLPYSLILVLVSSCSTTGNTLDLLMPDRWGVGAGNSSITGKTYGSGSSISHGRGGGGETTDRYEEVYNGDETLTATWLEWDIPNATDDSVSFTGMRDSFISDYRSINAPEPDGLLSVHRTVDQSGGETWSLGASEALTTAIIGLLAALGFKLRKDHKNGKK